MKSTSVLKTSLLWVALLTGCGPAFENATLSESITRKFAQDETATRSSNNIYSPNFIIQGGTPVMYYGGWEQAGQLHDNIYRAECHGAVTACDAGALIIDSAAEGFEHLNDPALVTLTGGRYLMYMTGVVAGANGLVLGDNKVYLATSTDAIHWSRPQLLLSDVWLPSATLDAGGNVILYGNGNGTTAEYLIRYNLGPNGNQVLERRAIFAPKAYANVDVQYRASTGLFHMLAETNTTGPNQIDALTSPDGISWTVVGDGILRPTAGAIYVRTPTSRLDDPSLIYYAQTRDPQNMANQIVVARWTWPTSGGGGKTPVVCVAPDSDQIYLTTAVTFFSQATALGGAIATQANDCRGNLEQTLTALKSQNWPCAPTQTTVQYVSTCVNLINSMAGL